MGSHDFCLHNLSVYICSAKPDGTWTVIDLIRRLHITCTQFSLIQIHIFLFDPNKLYISRADGDLTGHAAGCCSEEQVGHVASESPTVDISAVLGSSTLKWAQSPELATLNHASSKSKICTKITIQVGRVVAAEWQSAVDFGFCSEMGAIYRVCHPDSSPSAESCVLPVVLERQVQGANSALCGRNSISYEIGATVDHVHMIMLLHHLRTQRQFESPTNPETNPSSNLISTAQIQSNPSSESLSSQSLQHSVCTRAINESTISDSAFR